MKRYLLILAVALSTGSAFAQCIPNALYADSVFGVWPDTATDFRSGVLNTFYSDTLNMMIPNNSGEIVPDTSLPLDSVQLVSISGLPPGLSVVCNSQTAASCTYLPQILGCGLIEGIPTAVGTYPLIINVNVWFLLGFPQQLPYEFSGYEIVINEDNVGVPLNSAISLANVRNVPNPFNARTTIEFAVARTGDAKVRVYNMVGEEIWSQKMLAKAGQNKVIFEGNDLPAGVYLYKVDCGNETYTGRMALQR